MVDDTFKGRHQSNKRETSTTEKEGFNLSIKERISESVTLGKEGLLNE